MQGTAVPLCDSRLNDVNEGRRKLTNHFRLARWTADIIQMGEVSALSDSVLKSAISLKLRVMIFNEPKAENSNLGCYNVRALWRLSRFIREF